MLGQCHPKLAVRLRRNALFSLLAADRCGSNYFRRASPPFFKDSLMSFSDLGLLPELLRAVADKGYDSPSPIQIQAIPAVLSGRDVLAGAQTGTGKNGRVRAAYFAAPRRRSGERQQPGAPRTGADPNPRTGRASGSERPRLRQVHAVAHLPGVRRREHQPADQRPAQRLRCLGGDSGPLARSSAAARRGSLQDPGVGAR